MKVNRIAVGWALFALLLIFLAFAVIIPAFLAGPADGADPSRANTGAISHLSSDPASPAHHSPELYPFKKGRASCIERF